VPDIAAVRVESVPDSPDNYLIVVSPRPELSIGPFNFKVHVLAVTPDGELHPCASIEASGEMQPSCGVLPRLILLGEHPVPDQAEADICVRLPPEEWKIDRIDTDNSDTTVAQTGIQADGSLNLRLTQKISGPGDQVSHVRIVVRKPDKKTEVLTVEVRYYGQVSVERNLPEPAARSH
jgi:hypothetical protein